MVVAATSISFPKQHLLWKSHLGEHSGKAAKSTHHTHHSWLSKRGKRAFCRVSSSQDYFSTPKGNKGQKTNHVLCTRLLWGGLWGWYQGKKGLAIGIPQPVRKQGKEKPGKVGTNGEMGISVVQDSMGKSFLSTQVQRDSMLSLSRGEPWGFP